MKRTPLRSKPMRRRPLKKKGETDEQAVWRIVRSEVLERDEWTCQGRVRGMDHNCYVDVDGPGLHVHHILRRSQGGRDHPANLVTLCSTAHEWVHSHPAEAVRLGLLQRSGDTPCQRCGHAWRLHAQGGQCTYGPELGHECPCGAFVDESEAA